MSIIGKNQNKFYTIQPVLTDDHTDGGVVVVVHDMEEGTTFPLCVVEHKFAAIVAAQDHALGTDPQFTLENALEAVEEAARKFIDSNAFVTTGEAQRVQWALGYIEKQSRAGNIVSKGNA